MSDMTLFNISIQQIQIFLKAAELNSFTKAAKRYNYTPSMVSKTITAIEKESGIKLFDRNPQSIVLTPAGKYLANEWRQLTGAINHSIRKARQIQEGFSKKISIGFVDSSEKVDLKTEAAIKKFNEYYPEAVVIAEKHDMHRSVELLNSGLLDLALTSAIEVPYIEEYGLSWEKVAKTNAAAFVPKRNRLFNKEYLDFDELAETDFIVLDPVMHPSYNTWFNDLCSEHGITPNITGTFRTVRSLFFNLKFNDAVFIGETITSDVVDSEIKCFSLPEESFTVIAWRKDSSSEVIKFKEMVAGEYADF